ncbi:hypothetical protein RYX36_029750 [Vicia faba]
MSRNSPVTPVERSIESTMQVKNRKRKGVATSEDQQDSERYEEESSKDPSKDGDLKNLSNYCVWKKEVDDPEVVEKNILQIPQHVINTYSLIPISRIQLVDCDNGDKYDCELHTTRRANSVEKYIWQGWNDYTKKKRT